MVISSTAILATADVVSTLEFYKDVLGFESSWTWGEPPTFGSVSWGASTLMFNLQPELAARVEGHQHAINVDDVDAVYERQTSRGAKIVSPIEDKPWGLREYIVEDPSGYHLRFGGRPPSHAERSKPFPEGVTIVRRTPSEEEHAAVAGQEFYRSGVPGGVLEKTWGGIVALAPDGNPIGTVRIMCDAPGWYSIWDVAVLPEWQGQRIGEAMMKEALEVVREASPGAFVFLFTFKHGFYERLGFGKETVSMRKV